MVAAEELLKCNLTRRF